MHQHQQLGTVCSPGNSVLQCEYYNPLIWMTILDLVKSRIENWNIILQWDILHAAGRDLYIKDKLWCISAILENV